MWKNEPTRSIVRAAVSVLLVLVLPGLAGAQSVANSFEQLSTLVKPGDDLSLTPRLGPVVSGRVESVTPARLTLIAADGDRLSFDEAGVLQIRQRTFWRPKGVVFWAFGVGAGLGFVANGTDNLKSSALGALIGGGLGAGLGLSLYAMASGSDDYSIIYEPSRAQTGLRLSPLLGDGRKGVQARLTF